MMHSALAFADGTSSDIYRDLYDWFLAHPVFERWYQGSPWQLHCVGGPGSGKTTLAALVSEHIAKSKHFSRSIVVHVSVQHDVCARELEFLEDLLLAIYQELESKSEENDEDDEDSEDLFDIYVQERQKLGGCRVSRRIQLLQKAVYSCLANLPKSSHVYLVLDGYDRCSLTLKTLLDNELSALQQKDLSIFITSRLAVYENIESRCDHLNHGGAPDDDPIDLEDREVLGLCLECQVCEDIMCFPCRDAGRICRKCGNNDGLKEPYEFVNIRIGQIPNDQMTKYITWNLEREHGDLKLGSSAQKPPLSILGESLLAESTLNTAGALVERILDLALGDIGLAKARIDLVHEMESISDMEARRDQLPANILAMFDAGLRKLEGRSPEEKDLGLKAVAASGRDITGVSIPVMQRWLHQSISEDTRSGEDILEATNGFLFATTGDAIQKIQVYHTSFYYYVAKRHNLNLFEADRRLRADNARRMSSFAEVQASAASQVRFEPRDVPAEPAERTPFKLQRTVTAMDPIMEPIDDGPAHPFILRKGTRAWN
ncbi:hypothetical protein K491DRAFT_709514 [Lophiostoma macrostomum CBS 122681]|uniref:Nephrocystin 3-like N-terminal domain-containing protein n=1 Tax=Lophiostoma macrostomum CBS 122681 TaxID=1314788 RepID=A0A6A6TW37_9PLEO|nr:hypothetical protein K491DRAFT_709514 [Lophiostoma macrostomum CBS 122681]